MLIDLELKRFVGRCSVCGREFDAMSFAGITKKACDGCIERRDIDERNAKDAEASRARNAAMSAERWTELCPRAYRTKAEGGLTDFDRLSDEAKGVMEKLRSGAIPEERGVLLRGEAGTGKTRVMWRLLRKRFEKGQTIQAMTSGEFERSFREASGGHSIKPWFDALSGCDCLFIDDLGKSRWSDNCLSSFFDLVEARVAAARPVFLTTNYTRETLEQKLSVGSDLFGPLIRRIVENCELILLSKGNQ
jgi:DNA replication protein DnaC